MKLLRIIFDNIIIFKESFDIDLTATDRIIDDSGVHNIWGPINTLQAISIVGINAVGKTTVLKLMRLAMEVVLNNKGLNEDLVPSVFLNQEMRDFGIVMKVYFYNNDRVYELESRIKYKEKSENHIHFYYEDEFLKSKVKSSVTSKANIFDFTDKQNYTVITRSKLKEDLLGVLKDDDSIAILATKDTITTVKTMLDNVREKVNPLQGVVHEKILNVFDNNLAKLEKNDNTDGIRIEFKNRKTRIETDIVNLENIISSGTIKGQNLIKNAMTAFKYGGYLIVDELENHLNKELVRMIISIFQDVNINKNGACLIFTTHYAEILDTFDRKDNIYVLTRDESNLTKVNRYSNVVKRNELKKSEVILSNYIKGTAPRVVSIRELEEYICENI